MSIESEACGCNGNFWCNCRKNAVTVPLTCDYESHVIINRNVIIYRICLGIDNRTGGGIRTAEHVRRQVGPTLVLSTPSYRWLRPATASQRVTPSYGTKPPLVPAYRSCFEGNVAVTADRETRRTRRRKTEPTDDVPTGSSPFCLFVPEAQVSRMMFLRNSTFFKNFPTFPFPELRFRGHAKTLNLPKISLC